jgi:hypothetical protein
MAVLTAACALGIPAAFWSLQDVVLYVALIVIAAGSAATVVRRLVVILRALERP